MDAPADFVSLDRPSEVVSDVAPSATTSAAHHDSSTATHETDMPTDEPPSPHSAIYIPGRRAKRMAKLKDSTTTHAKPPLDLDDANATFIKEGSAKDFPEGSFNVLVSWEVSSNGQTNTIYRVDKSSM